MRVLKYKNGCASELLTRCKYFQVERLLLNTEGRKLAEFQAGKNSFHALLCVDGCGNISGEGLDGKSFNLNFFKGDCVFVPAESTATLYRLLIPQIARSANIDMESSGEENRKTVV